MIAFSGFQCIVRIEIRKREKGDKRDSVENGDKTIWPVSKVKVKRMQMFGNEMAWGKNCCIFMAHPESTLQSLNITLPSTTVYVVNIDLI